MKKNIGFIGMDSSLVRWLRECLHTPAAGAAGAEELAEGVENLLTGRVTALMLEMSTDDAPYRPKDTIVCGELAIWPRLRRVTQAGREVTLTPKEYDILLFLAQNRGEIFTKEQIYRAVWAEDYLMDDSNIMAFIRKLRKKIEPEPDSPRYILTIWGIGYKFNDQL